jgi:hypothetical protein
MMTLPRRGKTNQSRQTNINPLWRASRDWIGSKRFFFEKSLAGREAKNFWSCGRRHRRRQSPP